MKARSSACAIVLMGTFFTGMYSQIAISGQTPEADTAYDQESFQDLNDRFSYAYGYDLAEKFKAEGLELNVELMADGMQAVFNDSEKKMSAGEVAATLEIFREIQIKRREAEQAVAAEKNKKEGEAFLAANAKKDGVVVTESGLQYRILSEGTGDYRPTDD